MLRIVARTIAIVAMFALAAPTLATAEEPHGKPPPGRPGGGGKPVVAPHGPPGPGPGPRAGVGPGPRPGGPGPRPGFAGPGPRGPQFNYHGRAFDRVHLSPFVYPAGFAYQRWVVGGILPPVFLASAYFYADYATLGLPPPEPGFQWVRYGPDLLLVNVGTGQVVDVIYDAFY
jgi:Nickel/cobalt transporter regulator